MKLRGGDKVNITFHRLDLDDEGGLVKGKSDEKIFEVDLVTETEGEIYVNLVKRDQVTFIIGYEIKVKPQYQILSIKLTGDLEELKTNGKVGDMIEFETNLGEIYDHDLAHRPRTVGRFDASPDLYFRGEYMKEINEELIECQEEGSFVIQPPRYLTIVEQSQRTQEVIEQERLAAEEAARAQTSEQQGRLDTKITEGGGWKKKSKKKKKRKSKKKKKRKSKKK